MKIYFEDGKLRNTNQLPIKPDYIISAEDGVNANIAYLDNLRQIALDSVICTNSIFAFSNRYAWNNELQVPEIYIRAGKHMLFTRIDELTSKALREAHNLTRMYVAGAFDNQ